MKDKNWGILFIVLAVVALLLDEALGFPAKTTHGVMFVLLGVYLIMKGKR